MALVQYQFQDDEHTLVFPPHKNSKGSTPYKRTYPSTLQRIKEVAKECKPLSTFEQVELEMGGLEACTSNSGCLPRSKRQCVDVRKRLFKEENNNELLL